MIFRWKCNRCGKEIVDGNDRLKVCRLFPYKNVGDLCQECWNKTKGELNPVKDQGDASDSGVEK